MNAKITDYQDGNLLKIVNFLTEKENILIFLALSALCATFFVIIYNPYMFGGTPDSTWVTTGHMAFIVAAGMLLLILSRTCLWLWSRRYKITLAGCGLWLAIELIFIVVSLSMFSWHMHWNNAPDFTLLMGHILISTFCILFFPNIISILLFELRESRKEVLRLTSLQEYNSTHQIENNDKSINFFDRGGRLSFVTQNANLLYIEAADNYTNIHYINEGKEESFILHNSMKDIENRYGDMGLIRCHRGYMVNVENVKLMRKESSGLFLELNYTNKVIPVSKSYVESVVKRFS